MKRYLHGFTLIEMMFVVGIIGILTATSIPSYRIYLNQTRLLAAELSIRQAIIDYSIANDYSPVMLEDLVTSGYLKAIPNDPWTPVGSSLVARNGVMPSLVPSAYAAGGTLGIEDAGDWFYSNDGTTVIFYAKSHPGRIYELPSFGLPSLATPIPPPSPPSQSGQQPSAGKKQPQNSRKGQTGRQNNSKKNQRNRRNKH